MAGFHSLASSCLRWGCILLLLIDCVVVERVPNAGNGNEANQKKKMGARSRQASRQGALYKGRKKKTDASATNHFVFTLWFSLACSSTYKSRGLLRSSRSCERPCSYLFLSFTKSNIVRCMKYLLPGVKQNINF